MLKVEPMKTQVDDSSSELRQKLVFQLKRNMKLGGEVTDEMMDFLNPLEDERGFREFGGLCPLQAYSSQAGHA